MSVEDEKHNRDNNVCRSREKNVDKVRDHCHLTGKYKRPAHTKCNVNVKQKQSNFIPFAIHNFISYDYHLFF